jgi:nicotinate-nucleotide pyrophosphorylase (carboxylating)
MSSNLPPALHNELKRVVATALAEDIGTGDITSQLLIPESTQASMVLAAREGLVVCGTFVPAEVYKQLDGKIVTQPLAQEGKLVAGGTPLVKITGPARPILTGERTVLNLMQRMCGVATLTHVYADAVKDTKAIILDTRKTMPGMRHLDKYAVHTGGGRNHRMALDDMVLIKDNHIQVGGRDSGLGIGELIKKVRKELTSLIPNRKSPIPIVVECDTLEQVAEAIEAKPDRILLDNMDIKKLCNAVALVAGRVPLEASGGVSLDKVRDIAEAGVNFISVGKLTHSAPSADIGADITYS